MTGTTFSRRGVLKAGGAAAVALAAGACGAGGPAGGSATGALTVLCEAGGKAELTKIAEKYTKDTGRAVTFVELPYDGLFNRLSTELSSGAVSFDVAALDAIWLSTFASALRPLDALFTPAVRDDLFPSLVADAQIGGKFVGMPVWTNVEILFYRKDLFDNDKEKAAFRARYGYPLAPPSTWKQFQDTAEFFTRDGVLYGTEVKGAVETEWLAHVLQAGSPGVVLDQGGAVIIDNQQHLDALKFYAGLVSASPPGAAQLDWAGAQNLFNQGKTAMLRFWAHQYPLIPADAPIHGKVGVAPMVAGSAGVGGVPGPWFLSVPTASTQGDAATDFVRFAYDNNALAIESELGLAARRSAFEQYSAKPGYEHFAPLLTTLSAPATKGRPAHPKWQQIVDDVLVPLLQKSVVPGADHAALLAGARKDVESLVR